MSDISFQMKRWKRIFKDNLRYSRLSRQAYSVVNGATGACSRDEATRLVKWLDSYRFAASGGVLENLAMKRIAPWREGEKSSIWRDSRIGWGRFRGWQQTGPLSRTVVLKAPSPHEKGVLLVTFEYNWFKLLRNANIARRIEEDYDIIFSTSSSPGDYTMLGLALSTLTGPIYVMSCHYDEIAKFESFHPRVRCLPVLPCDWLAPDAYEPKPWSSRTIDILMVAGWGPVKRHWHFFDALRSLPSDLKVVLVGQPDGKHDRDSILRLAHELRVPQQLEVLESLEIDQVRTLQCDSRISSIFSRREGCCVAVAESLMANSPVALVSGTHMGPAAYINESTGCFLPLRGTGRALRDFLERGESFAARQWAIENIANDVSAKKLQAFFAQQRAAAGQAWSGALATPSWRPHPMINEADASPELISAFTALHRDFPELFPENLIRTSRL